MEPLPKARILYITPRGFHASSEVVIYDLEREGYEITRADDIEQAKAIYQETRPDLVLLDIRLPGMDGIEVLRRIKKINKDISVIMITAFADEEATKAAVKEGAYDYIMKPFDLAYLELSVLTKVINNIKR